MAQTKREALIAGLTELSYGPGLEIAPLNKPAMPKSKWDVHYVDIISTDGLREHYADDPNVPINDIVEVDFPLTDPNGKVRRLSQVAKAKAPFAWVVASHVIEHVPDLITWLEDIASLLRDGGDLVLAVPDMRYSFDAYRPQTTVGQMLQAREQGDVVPSVRAVYDYISAASTITAADAWGGRRPGLEGSRAHGLDMAIEHVKKARAGEYVDSHVWMFRPSTLIEQINELGRLGLCEFTVESVRNTRPGQLEFFAVLRRLPRDRTPELDARLRGAGKQRTNDEPTRFLPAATAQIALSEREQRLIRRKRAVTRRVRAIVARRG